MMPFLALYFLAAFLVFSNILPRIGVLSDHRPLALTGVLQESAPSVSLVLVGLAIFVYLSVSHRRCANAGERTPQTTLFAGDCYLTAPGSHAWLFALIGPGREQAQWFCLPLDWDSAIEPGRDRYTLTYTPATGFVERLERSGAEPRTLTHSPNVSDYGSREDAEAVARESADEGNDGEATPEQRRELKRAFRRVGMAWGISAPSLFLTGMTLLVGGVCFIAMIVFILALLSIHPQPRAHGSDTGAAAAYCLLFGTLGMGLLIWGARVLRIWVQRRYAEGEAPLVIEGKQVCWSPYRDLYSGNNESLAQVRLDDGEERIFRIPRRWLYRVRRANGRVRVTYNPQTWLVLDYRPLVAPTSV